MIKLILLLALPCCLPAQQYQPILDSFMRIEVSVNHFNGNVLVAKSGHIIFQQSYGYRNYQTQEKLDDQSIFELASVSKQFTAMGILLLAEKGKLQLTDSLRKFFPDLPYSNIIIQNLLVHNSGLPDYITAMAAKWDHRRVVHNHDLIKFLDTANIPVRFKAGEKYEYSNTAYVLLASIIEQVSGQHFSDYMNTHIFRPLGMEHTGIYDSKRTAKLMTPNYAIGYIYSDSLKSYIIPDNLPKLDLVNYLDGIQGDGAVHSTTGDLLKWDRALKNHLLLTEATQKEMFSPHVLYDTLAKTYYGYGVFLGSNELGSYIAHNGIWPGYRTNLIRYVKDDITIIILSNNQSNALLLGGPLAYLVSGKPVVFPYFHKETAIDPALLIRYTGKYTVPNAGEIELIIKAGKLYRHKLNTEDIELKSESATKFFYANDDPWLERQIEFQIDRSGKLINTFMISSGVKREIQRL